MLITINKILTRSLKVIAQTTSILALLTLSCHADDFQGDEVQQWLNQQSTIPSAHETINFSSANLLKHFESPMVALEPISSDSPNNKIIVPYKKMTKANYKRLARKLSEKLKLTLFTGEGRNRKHQFYVNTVKQELVGKASMGRANYELRVSEDKAEAHFRIRF